MELTYQCSNCHSVNHASLQEAGDRVTCRACACEQPLRRESMDDECLSACPLCATTDLYVQKDFPQGLGLFIVVIGFVISTVFWYFERPVLTYLVLLASALLDMMLYYRVPDVTICYRCLSQVRGPGSNPSGRYHPFDLAIGERYRQERIRIEELRKRGASVELSPSPVSTGPPSNT